MSDLFRGCLAVAFSLFIAVVAVWFLYSIAPGKEPQVLEAVSVQAPPNIGVMMSSEEIRLWSEVAEYRQKLGLSKIKTDPSICELAQIRSKEVLLFWGHEGEHGVNGYTVKEAQVRATYCPECTYLAENLARVNLTPAQTLRGWLNSPPHRKLIERPRLTTGCTAISYNELGEKFEVLLLGEK